MFAKLKSLELYIFKITTTRKRWGGADLWSYAPPSFINPNVRQMLEILIIYLFIVKQKVFINQKNLFRSLIEFLRIPTYL
jgi:hypothetical protein